MRPLETLEKVVASASLQWFGGGFPSNLYKNQEFKSPNDQSKSQIQGNLIAGDPNGFALLTQKSHLVETAMEPCLRAKVWNQFQFKPHGVAGRSSQDTHADPSFAGLAWGD